MERESNDVGVAGGSETLRRLQANEITLEEYTPALSTEAAIITANSVEARRRKLHEAAREGTVTAKLKKFGRSLIQR